MLWWETHTDLYCRRNVHHGREARFCLHGGRIYQIRVVVLDIIFGSEFAFEKWFTYS